MGCQLCVSYLLRFPIMSQPFAQLSLELASAETTARSGPQSVAQPPRVAAPRLTLGEAARIIREAVKDKSYRSTPLGQLVGRYLRWFRNEFGATESTLRDYEAVLARMSLTLADKEPAPLLTPRLREGPQGAHPPATRPRARRAPPLPQHGSTPRPPPA